MLEIRGLEAGYGKILALRGVSMTVGAGEIVTLIGPNGAGKTTLIKAVTKALKPRSGEVLLDGRSITALKTEAIARRGLAVVPEGRRLFAPMSVVDNLMLGAYLRLTKGERKGVAADLDRVFALFPRLGERREQRAGTLSGGEQQMVAIGRSLMAAPRLILMDEPSIGLAPVVAREIFAVVEQLREDGLAILLVEQNARMALRIADRAYVMELGEVVYSGAAAEIRDLDAVKQIYLTA
jgi:branched-chain amino acid transport system ATP-binding protein